MIFFLTRFPEPFRQQSVDAMRRLVSLVDGFIVHSQDYGKRMAELLQIPDRKWQVVPLGIDTHDFEHTNGDTTHKAFTIGYFARMSPEKGLDHLVDAFIELSKRSRERWSRTSDGRMDGAAACRLSGPSRQAETESCKSERSMESYLGTLERQKKLEFFGQIDLLSVPDDVPRT